MGGRKPAAIDSDEGRFTGIARPSNVIEVKTESSQGSHSAPFPPALVEFFVKAFSDPGDLVFDPFLGSGTTLAAAHVLGRAGYGCEISPAYCDVILHRISKLAQQEPKLAGSGASLAEVTAERGVGGFMNIDLQIERWPVERLIPRVTNPRTHTPEQVSQIAGSIKEWGWTNPILVGADNDVIAGHARLLAARKLGMKEVPVIVLRHLSEAQRRALVIADNQLALNSGWDEELLRSELAMLQDEHYDLDLIGFEVEELDDSSPAKTRLRV